MPASLHQARVEHLLRALAAKILMESQGSIAGPLTGKRLRREGLSTGFKPLLPPSARLFAEGSIVDTIGKTLDLPVVGDIHRERGTVAKGEP